MGNTFEIWSWKHLETGWAYVQLWTGENEGEAFTELRHLKNTGDHPCLKLEWR